MYVYRYLINKIILGRRPLHPLRRHRHCQLRHQPQLFEDSLFRPMLSNHLEATDVSRSVRTEEIYLHPLRRFPRRPHRRSRHPRRRLPRHSQQRLDRHRLPADTKVSEENRRDEECRTYVIVIFIIMGVIVAVLVDRWLVFHRCFSVLSIPCRGFQRFEFTRTDVIQLRFTFRSCREEIGDVRPERPRLVELPFVAVTTGEERASVESAIEFVFSQ